MGRGSRRDLRGWCCPLPPMKSPSQPRRGEGTYIKVVAVHSLIVQGDRHSDANICLPLDGGGGDDEVVGVVPHQVHLKHAVQALGQKREETSQNARSQDPERGWRSKAAGVGEADEVLGPKQDLSTPHPKVVWPPIHDSGLAPWPSCPRPGLPEISSHCFCLYQPTRCSQHPFRVVWFIFHLPLPLLFQ